jgi:hypothetical protein
MRLVLVAVATALVAAGGAGGAPVAHTFPKLLVQEHGPSTTIEIVHDDLDDAAEDLAIFAPAGYEVALAEPIGTTIGTARGLVTAPDLGLARIVVTGGITVRSPDSLVRPAEETVSLEEAAERCTGTPSHAAFWVLTLKGSGATLELPLFVDRAAATAARFASATIRACLPPPDLPAGRPGRAPLGYELASMAITLRGVFGAAPAGERRWRLLETEYARGTSTPNLADRSESQAVVYAGSPLTLAAPRIETRAGVATVILRGRTAIPASAEARYRVDGGSVPALHMRASLSAAGHALTARLRVRQTSARQVLELQLRGAVETLGLGPAYCRPTFRPDGVPCVYATRMGTVVRSPIRRVVIPPA